MSDTFSGAGSDARGDAIGESRTGAVAGVIVALERLVLEELRPGGQLPSEAELARRLSVSRLTVREAVRALEARGLVSLQRGRRAVVRTPNGELAGHFFRTAVRRDPAVVFELIELRRALETHIAGLAALRATNTARASIEAAVLEMDAIAARPPVDEEAFLAADVRFHEALAAATGNAVLTHLIEELAEPLRILQRQSWRGREHDNRTLASVTASHRAVLAGVIAGEPRSASAAMLAHLDEVERDLQAAMNLV